MLGIAAGVYAGYAYLLPVAVPFLAAWLLAVWLYPAAVKIEKKTRIKKSIAGTVLLLLVFVSAGLVLYAGVRELLLQLRTAAAHFPEWLQAGEALLSRAGVFLEETLGIGREDSRLWLGSLTASMEDALLGLGPYLAKKLYGWMGGLLLFLSGAGVAFITAVLVMGDMENLRKKIWDYSWLVGARRVVKRLRKTTAVYIKAQAAIMALVAVVCSVGFWMMKSPYFLILGLVLGALDALPLLGTGTFLYPAAVYYLLQGRAGIAAGCVLLDIVTSFLREFLEPRLLGGNLGVSPIAVIASVYIGVFVFGGWGVLLGPLSFSTAYEIGKEWDVWD